MEGGVGWLPSVFPSYGVCCVLLQSSLESAVHALRDCRTRAKTVVDDGYRCAPVFSLPVAGNDAEKVGSLLDQGAPVDFKVRDSDGS